MKKSAPLFLALISVFSFHCLAQRSVPANVKITNTQLSSEKMSQNDLAVVSYHVEERINMAFGSTVTTYDVSSLNLVSTHDLGQNNVRVVTPKYEKVRVKAVALDELSKASVATITAAISRSPSK